MKCPDKSGLEQTCDYCPNLLDSDISSYYTTRYDICSSNEHMSQIACENDFLISILEPQTVNDDVRLMVRVATLYYKHQLLQSEIAERIGLSRQTVGRLLQRANDLGIVKVEIQQPFAYLSELELQLENRFGLNRVIVVSPLDDEDETIKAALGEAAAAYLQECLKDDDILGASSGSSTLYQCALHIQPAHMSNLTVVSLNGAGPYRLDNPNVDLSVMLIGRALGAKTVLLPAPRFVDDASIKTSFMSDSNIASVIQVGNRANVVLLGVGIISENNTLYRQGFLGKDLLDTVRLRGGVGEILGHGFDAEGHLCSPEISSRTIAVELETLREKSLAVAVAGGVAKAEAIYGGIQGRYFNVLITDESAARSLLELAYERHDTAPASTGKKR